MNVLRQLQQLFCDALSGFAPDPGATATLVRPAQDPRHGDYQANCAMPLAKNLKRKPRDVAEEIVARLGDAAMLAAAKIDGPGFINLRLRDDWLAGQLQRLAADDRLGIELASAPKTFVIDFSSPNVAKPMHVGHLRSTIIGDSLARLLRFLGHRVITDNHLGDWGTQFGILLHGYKHHRDESALRADPVREMVRLYVLVTDLIKAEEQSPAKPVTDAARSETARLQAGNPENVALWEKFMPWCREEIDRVYRRLDVRFDHTLGESFYNPRLAGVVEHLLAFGVAQTSEGAVAVFLSGVDDPAIIRKRDGAFTYTTSDLATVAYRIEEWHPDVILYVVDARQALHFKNLFEIARRLCKDSVALEHISFGSVLGPDRKPIKTREGGAIELDQLLDEAVERGRQTYEKQWAERRARGEEAPELGDQERRAVAEAVGLGAVKYADLSQNRSTDYVFSWDKMLAMDGNTATYMQYAHARIQAIFRKGGEDAARLRADPPAPVLGAPQERALGLQLLRLPEALDVAATEYRPNVITAYLWDLARAYSAFYENCPVLRAETPELRRSRLLVCDLTARSIHLGLQLLGIRTVERM